MTKTHLYKLTPREQQITSLVALGLSNIQIAKKLGISEGTVRTHVSVILGKLHFTNRTQIAIWVRQQEIKPDDEVLSAISRIVSAVRARDIFGFLGTEITTADRWLQQVGANDH